MSLAITHFALGGALTLLLYSLYSEQYRYRTTAVASGGVWALVPDAHYVLPGNALEGIKDTLFGDLFWFHATLDGLVQGRGTRSGAAVAVILLLIVVTGIELWNSQHVSVVEVSDTDTEDDLIDL